MISFVERKLYEKTIRPKVFLRTLSSLQLNSCEKSENYLKMIINIFFALKIVEKEKKISKVVRLLRKAQNKEVSCIFLEKLLDELCFYRRKKVHDVLNG
jgi:PII-like signaling protein